MSKAIDAIQAEWTGKAGEFYPGLRAMIERKDIQSQEYPEVREYKIGFDWRFLITCEPRRLEDAIKNAQGQLKEFIYGDLRDRILQLERHILDQEYMKAEDEMTEILREVF
jgi:hypothetical protein